MVQGNRMLSCSKHPQLLTTTLMTCLPGMLGEAAFGSEFVNVPQHSSTSNIAASEDLVGGNLLSVRSGCRWVKAGFRLNAYFLGASSVCEQHG